MMELVSDIERTNNAWAVGRFDVLTSQAKLPDQIASQVGAVKWFAAAGHINGGLSGTLRAEARDDQSAENLRDVVRGVLALGRLQAQSDPRLSAVAQSLQLTGTGKTVSLSFTVPAELLDMAMSHAQGSPETSRSLTARPLHLHLAGSRRATAGFLRFKTPPASSHPPFHRA